MGSTPMDAAPTAPAAAPLDKGKAKLGPPPPPVVSAPAPIDTAAQPWVEKYRPKTLDDVCAHREIIDTIRRLVEEAKLPHLMFYGPPGTGKTSTILAVARQLYGAASPSMVLELNASDDRGIGVVRQQVVDFASTRTIFSNKFKLVILDECDAMTKDAQFALRRVIEKYARNARFCLICNYASKIIPALQSRCTRFRFPPLSEPAVRGRVAAVCAAEGVSLTPAGMDAVVSLGAGDMRRTLNILQATAMAVSGGGGGGNGGGGGEGGGGGGGGAPSTAGREAGAGVGMGVTVDGPAVYATTGTPPPADVEAFARLLLNASFADALDAVAGDCAAKGYALVDIIGGLLPLIQRLAMPPPVRGDLVIALADVEAALAAGANERLQLGALVGAFACAREGIVKAAV